MALLALGAIWELDASGRVSVLNMGSQPGRSRVADVDLAHLKKLKALRELNLAHSNITDAAFEHIVKHPRLKLLNLDGTQVTDAGIASLHRMPNLKEVMLANTRVTQEGVQKLRRALPGCTIAHP
jgi:hypothetical protein